MTKEEYEAQAAAFNGLLNRLEQDFTYHPPNEGQASRYRFIRAEGKDFAQKLAARCPLSRELSLALTKIEEAVFWANAAIARNERSDADANTTTEGEK